MWKSIVLIPLLAFLTQVSGQTVPDEYYTLTKRGDSLFQAKNYHTSALTYSHAFKILGWKGLQEDRYRAARSWALSGNQDSAFFNLERIASKVAYSDYQRVITDDNLTPLHANPRWQLLLHKIKANQDSILKAEEKLDKNLVAKLDSMAKEDQRWRKLSTLKKIANREIPKDSIKWTDPIFYPELTKIFRAHGFPNYDLVGVKGSHNFWLLVQHQDMHPVFQDSVLVALKAEAEKGKASWKDYAYLIDRVKCNTGQPQIYGTQVNWIGGKTLPEPKPVIEPEKLNERRKSVGLNTEEEYLKFMQTHLAEESK